MTSFARLRTDYRSALKLRRVFSSATSTNAQKVSSRDARVISLGLARARRRLGELFTPSQVMGRRDTIGCVAVEITQRCNLDCSLCYLSDNSEDVKDIPLQEVFRRLDMVRSHYGPGAAVQITGGDPTLRKRSELVEIVRYTTELGLQPALFTNGIKATRDLLEELVEVGLVDVAFHVDITQERKGYATEESLHEIRREYIERARGLPVTVIFNTTVCAENFSEIPSIVEFFKEHSDVVRMSSFQLQADTGRGELTEREGFITRESIREKIHEGVGVELVWDPVTMGHAECNSSAMMIAINKNLYQVLSDKQLIADFLEDFRHVHFNRRNGVVKNALLFTFPLLRRPRWIMRLGKVVLSYLWQAKYDLLKSRGRIDRLSFFLHNFMDAENLVPERVGACSFMVMTHEGPVSMCDHNARRDDYILKPIQINTKKGKELWDPMRERPMKNRKARGQRDWKKSESLTNGAL